MDLRWVVMTLIRSEKGRTLVGLQGGHQVEVGLKGGTIGGGGIRSTSGSLKFSDELRKS